MTGRREDHVAAPEASGRHGLVVPDGVDTRDARSLEVSRRMAQSNHDMVRTALMLPPSRTTACHARWVGVVGC